jgi:ATPase subunit of ABC transporter with duplicated ATPase domains
VVPLAWSAVLVAKNLYLAHGDRPVLVDVSLAVNPGDRIGVVGPNGIGKSSLLRILAALDEADAGSVERSPRTLTVGLLRQEIDPVGGETVRNFLARQTGITGATTALDAATEAMGVDDDSIVAHADALDRFLALGGDDFEARLGTVIAGLGLPDDRVDLAVTDLSGGQAARVGLAAILLSRQDVLLLDEPTNDLDLDGLDQLERFVDSSPAAIVTVSHDRAFLDRCVHRMVELTEEHHRSVEYAGGWSDYVEARALGRRQQSGAHQQYVAERDRLTERMRNQRQWSEDGARGHRKGATDNDKFLKNFKAERSENQAAKVRATEKQLARLTPVDKPWEGWQLHMNLSAEQRSGDVVGRLDRAVVRRGSFALGPIDVEVHWQDRVGIVGPNGSGKSTLLAALLGELPLAGGTRWWGPGVRVGTLDQRRSAFASDETLQSAFQARTGLGLSEARSLLAKFGLGADEVARQVGHLSPGERTRAELAALTAEGVNCLVLDEPTNHLDLPAIEQLEQALSTYDGTLLLVSHDRWFLDQVGLTRTIELAPPDPPSPDPSADPTFDPTSSGRLIR